MFLYTAINITYVSLDSLTLKIIAVLLFLEFKTDKKKTHSGILGVFVPSGENMTPPAETIGFVTKTKRKL